MYRLLFGYPRLCCNSDKLCRPRCEEKNSSNSTVRRADLTGPAARTAAGAADSGAGPVGSAMELVPPVDAARQAQRVVLAQFGWEQPVRGVLEGDRTQEPA